MRVLHISTNDSTGAGLCAYRIHHSLLKLGVDSEMLVLDRSHDEERLMCRGIYRMRYFVYRLFHKILRILHINIFEFDKVITQSIESGAAYSLPTSIFDLSKDPIVKAADIIHLHWADGFVDYPSFLSTLNKPIVWTLHDENLFYGTSHYSDSILYDDPLERKYFRIKHDMIANAKNLSLVFLSQHFLRKFGNEKMLNNKSIFVVNNSVNSSKFYPIKDETIREKLGVSRDTILLSFIAGRINDPHKGLEILLQAIEYFPNKRIKVLAIGGNNGFQSNEKVKSVGMITDVTQLSKLLSASNYFVMPSLQEAFSQAPLEAMSCGIPVVAFPVSGTEELINDSNGVICKGFGVLDLVDGLEKAFNMEYNSDIIRTDVQKRFSPKVIAEKYISIYKSSLN